jgi:hypothetical protein
MNVEKKSKRVVFTMGGKGGVGKTGLMVALAEWFEATEIPFTLLDLDTENKARGSLKHFFNGSVAKVNIHTPAGLDAFVDHLESGAAISAISNRATTTTRIGRSKAGGTGAALNCLVSKERLPLRISRQCVRVSTHKRENSSGNVTGQIALPAMVRSKVRRVLFMT